MKVFISYSSMDSWIADKVAVDIQGLGIEVFHDRKDVETGDDIDDVIRDQIVSSSEMLALISHAALQSHWVMMEFGAARTLRKRLVPILVGLSPNELPQPINRHLARDLNQIERYYDELRERMRTGEPLDPPALILPPPSGPLDPDLIGIGSPVAIADRVVDPERFPVLNDDMRQYLGLDATVIGLGWQGLGVKTFRLDVDDGTFYWADRWLVPRSGLN